MTEEKKLAKVPEQKMAKATTAKSKMIFASGITFEELQREAAPLALCGYFGKSGLANMSTDSPEYRTAMAQMISKLMVGADLGFSVTMSARCLYVVNGRVGLESSAYAALIDTSEKYDYDVLEHDESICTLQFWVYKRGAWQKMRPVSFTIADAKRAKLDQKDNWKCYPQAMLFAKALLKGARMYCGGLLFGINTREELEDIQDMQPEYETIDPDAEAVIETIPNRKEVVDPDAETVTEEVEEKPPTNPDLFEGV